MFFSNINAVSEIKFFPPAILDAIEFIRETDFSDYEAKRYNIQNDDIYYLVMDLKTQPIETVKAESHGKYIDIQYLFSGREMIGVGYDDGNNVVDENFLKSRDAIFYKTVFNESFLALQSGNYAIFFPEDIHRPGCLLNTESHIRKVVFKISLDSIK